MAKELVTPEIAENLLAHNPKNRHLRKDYVKGLAAAMTNGTFLYNGESVIIDDEGNLLDGQHRLSAVVLSGTSHEMEVVRGVPCVARRTIDVGEKRSVADHLSMEEWSYPHTLANAARTLNAFEAGVLNRINAEGRFYPSDADRILNKHPLLCESVALAAAVQGDMKRVFPRHGEVAFFHYVFTRANQPAGDTFIQGMAFGSNLTTDSPILRLRSILLDDIGSRKKLSDTVKRALIIKAWNFHTKNATVKRLQYLESEAFPRIEGIKYNSAGKPVLP